MVPGPLLSKLGTLSKDTYLIHRPRSRAVCIVCESTCGGESSACLFCTKHAVSTRSPSYRYRIVPSPLQQRASAHSAWVSLPSSHIALGGSGSTATTTSPWVAAPRPSARDGSSSVAQSLPSRKRRIAAALFYSLRDRRHGPAEAAADETVVPGLPSISSPFLAHLGGAAHHARGQSAGGFQLGAVTAVRSPGDGGGAATAVEGGEELREAFNAAVGEEEFLGLDGFRVGAIVVVAHVVNAVVVGFVSFRRSL